MKIKFFAATVLPKGENVKGRKLESSKTQFHQDPEKGGGGETFGSSNRWLKMEEEGKIQLQE